MKKYILTLVACCGLTAASVIHPTEDAMFDGAKGYLAAVAMGQCSYEACYYGLRALRATYYCVCTGDVPLIVRVSPRVANAYLFALAFGYAAYLCAEEFGARFTKCVTDDRGAACASAPEPGDSHSQNSLQT